MTVIEQADTQTPRKAIFWFSQIKKLSTIHEEQDDTDSATPQPKRKGQPITPFHVSPTKKHN
jgi:hypothetical protein